MKGDVPAPRPEAPLDCLLLAAVVFLSSVPYVPGLGLYSDDWAFLSALQRASGGYRDLLDAIKPMELATRPVQGIFLAGLYWLFELDPLGYHAVNTAVLTAAVLLFYLSLRRLGFPRVVALAVPLIFGTLPHYSTDRFWIAVFQANLSVCLFFLSFYADLRFVGHPRGSGWLWKALGAVALVASVLAYEVIAALFLVGAAVMLYLAGTRAREAAAAREERAQDEKPRTTKKKVKAPRQQPWLAQLRTPWALEAQMQEVPQKLSQEPPERMPAEPPTRRRSTWVRPAAVTAIGVGINALLLSVAIGYSLSTTAGAEQGDLRSRAMRILTEAVPVHFLEYGLALPLKVLRALLDYPDPTAIAVSTMIGIGVALYLYAGRHEEGSFGDGESWALLVLLGGALFVAGYSMSLITWEIGFHPTGPNNRTAIGATIGVAWVFTGLIGWIVSRIPPEPVRWITFSVAIGLLAASGTLLTNTVAGFWVRSADQQYHLIESVRQRFPTLPTGTTLLLDGICSFDGPAPVFATSWDVTGMLNLTYDDQTVRGDVVKPSTELTQEGVRTTLFGDVINVYPYGDQLVVFHVPTGESVTLTNREAAWEYFQSLSIPGRPHCAPYTDGNGEEVF